MAFHLPRTRRWFPLAVLWLALAARLGLAADAGASAGLLDAGAPALVEAAADAPATGPSPLLEDERRGPPGQGKSPPEEELGFGWALVRLFLVLGVVIAVTYLALNHGLRRLMGVRAVPLARSGTLLEVVERAPLDQKGSLYVVRAASDYLLVGRSESGLTLLSKLDAAEVRRLIAEQPQPQMSPFLQKLLQRSGGGPK